MGNISKNSTSEVHMKKTRCYSFLGKIALGRLCYFLSTLRVDSQVWERDIFFFGHSIFFIFWVRGTVPVIVFLF